MDAESQSVIEARSKAMIEAVGEPVGQAYLLTIAKNTTDANTKLDQICESLQRANSYAVLLLALE